MVCLPGSLFYSLCRIVGVPTMPGGTRIVRYGRKPVISIWWQYSEYHPYAAALCEGSVKSGRVPWEIEEPGTGNGS